MHIFHLNINNSLILNPNQINKSQKFDKAETFNYRSVILPTSSYQHAARAASTAPCRVCRPHRTPRPAPAPPREEEERGPATGGPAWALPGGGKGGAGRR